MQEMDSLEKGIVSALEEIVPDSLNQNFLVAVSGGMDSVALLRILSKNGYSLKVAHVNYQLRGEESDEDEEFCRKLCSDLSLPFFVHKADPELFKAGLSVQAVAREIRYQWFEELRKQENCAYILTGHHRDDQAETIIMQALRRKAFKIFSPIAKKNGFVIRPMLGVSRAEIKEWMVQHQFPWREDSSNAEDIYLRNKVRHRVIPELLQIQPSLNAHMEERVGLYQAQFKLLEKFILPQVSEFLNESDGQATIRLDKLNELFGAEAFAVLAYLLDHWGESHSILTQVLRLMDASTGRKVAGLSGIYFRDRENLVRVPFTQQPTEQIWVPGIQQGSFNGFSFSFREYKPGKDFVPNKSPQVLSMDASRVSWPLIIRPWQSGDRMKPLGMEGSRKVSDILTGIKLSAHQRESAFVITSNEKVIFVQGYRIANKIRIRKDTRRILEIRITQEVSA
jgi:tRNA(Ile)-lysidine synthase